MKVSPNGKYIACALYSSQTQNYHAELYTFDPNTGVVASHLQFPLQNQTYGVEFSPNSQRLFLGADPNLFQFDLTDPTPQTILNSQFTVHDAQTNGGGAVWGLQLGPDGKIYVAHVNTTKLGVVHTPNNYVGVGFVPLSTDLANRQCQYNLPTFLQSIFAEPEPCTNTNMRFFTVFRKSYVCTDCTNGKIAVNVIGGQAPITYSRDGINYQTSGIFDNLGPGSYTIYAKDANGCIISRTVVLQN